MCQGFEACAFRSLGLQASSRLGGENGINSNKSAKKQRHANRIADAMEQWLFEEGCDRFNIMFPYVPEGLDDFVDKVVPELQRRGLFRREYEGKTLRDNLGLPRPENQVFKSPKDLSGQRAEVALEVHRHQNG